MIACRKLSGSLGYSTASDLLAVGEESLTTTSPRTHYPLLLVFLVSCLLCDTDAPLAIAKFLVAIVHYHTS